MCAKDIVFPNKWELIGDVKVCEDCVQAQSSKNYDIVNRPSHYNQGIETIEIIKSKMSKEMYEGYLLGNIIKYITRYKHKNGLQDLEKAEWYMKKLIELEKES